VEILNYIWNSKVPSLAGGASSTNVIRGLKWLFVGFKATIMAGFKAV
jgi:hypothetical protein